MANTSKTAQANAQFKKAQREQDGKKAMAEYEAEGIALRAKTAKLRALRLARDAAEAAAAEAGGKSRPPIPSPEPGDGVGFYQRTAKAADASSVRQGLSGAGPEVVEFSRRYALMAAAAGRI